MSSIYNPTTYEDLPYVVRRLFGGREHRVRFGANPLEVHILPSGLQIFPMSETERTQEVFGTLENLIHEMCHFVEIEERRIRVPGYGFMSLLDGIQPTESQYRAMRERETRVAAFEINILAEIEGSDEDMADHIEAQTNLIARLSLPANQTGEVWVNDEPKESTIREIRNLLDILRRDPTYSLKSFEERWFRRIAMIEEIEASELAENVERYARFPKAVEEFESADWPKKQKSVVYTTAQTIGHQLRIVSAVLTQNGNVLDSQQIFIGHGWGASGYQMEMASYHALLLGIHVAKTNKALDAEIMTESKFVKEHLVRQGYYDHDEVNHLRSIATNLLKGMPSMSVILQAGYLGYLPEARAKDLENGFLRETTNYEAPKTVGTGQ